MPAPFRTSRRRRRRRDSSPPGQAAPFPHRASWSSSSSDADAAPLPALQTSRVPVRTGSSSSSGSDAAYFGGSVSGPATSGLANGAASPFDPPAVRRVFADLNYGSIGSIGPELPGLPSRHSSAGEDAIAPSDHSLAYSVDVWDDHALWGSQPAFHPELPHLLGSPSDEEEPLVDVPVLPERPDRSDPASSLRCGPLLAAAGVVAVLLLLKPAERVVLSGRAPTPAPLDPDRIFFPAGNDAARSGEPPPPFPNVHRWGDPIRNFMDRSLLAPDLAQGPFPTGAFWTNLVLRTDFHAEAGEEPIVSYPYAFRWKEEGLEVSYPALRREFLNNDTLRDLYAPDLKVGALPNTTSLVPAAFHRRIESHDAFSVALRFDADASATDPDAPGFTVPVVTGAPYVTVLYRDAVPLLRPHGSLLRLGCLADVAAGRDDGTVPAQNCVASNNQAYRGTEFAVVQEEGAQWAVFAQPATTLEVREGRAAAGTANYTGVIRMALLPPRAKDREQAVRELRKFHTVYPTGCKIVVDFSNAAMKIGRADDAIMRYQFLTETSDPAATHPPPLLMLALPHLMGPLQYTKMVAPLASAADTGWYDCIKGVLTPVFGNVWKHHQALTQLKFQMDGPLRRPAMKDEIKKALKEDLMYHRPTAGDVYTFGKQAARLATLALVAEEVEDQDTLNTIVELLRTALVPWLEGEAGHETKLLYVANPRDALLYDKDLGGIVTHNGLRDPQADFGNGRYNDHHFHYGYLIYAAAVLTRFDPSFVDDHGNHISALVKDVANYDPGDPHYPLARHKSWYDGHSWASGLFPQSDGKSQESVSEAVNCYYAVGLWALVTRDDTLHNFSRLLLAMEIRGAHYYWQTGPTTKVYADQAFDRHYMVGVAGALDVTTRTWFGNDPVYSHGINILPITPITAELLAPEYVAGEWAAVLEPVYDTAPVAWRGYLAGAHAVIDPEAAWGQIRALSSQKLDNGLGRAQALLWAGTRTGSLPPYDPAKEAEAVVPGGAGASCKARPGCVARGYGGDCCPTPEGVFRTCCTEVPFQGPETCARNTRCHEAGLEGRCCPDDNGVFLGCCGAEQGADAATGDDAGDGTGTGDAKCASHEACGGLGGDCCPTDAGVFLGCCTQVGGDTVTSSSTAPTASATSASTGT